MIVGVFVGAAVFVTVALELGLAVAVALGVAVPVGVAVVVTLLVTVDVGVTVTVNVCVTVVVVVFVTLAVLVGTTVEVCVGTAVEVCAGAAVNVAVGTLVAVTFGGEDNVAVAVADCAALSLLPAQAVKPVASSIQATEKTATREHQPRRVSTSRCIRTPPSRPERAQPVGPLCFCRNGCSDSRYGILDWWHVNTITGASCRIPLVVSEDTPLPDGHESRTLIR